MSQMVNIPITKKTYDSVNVATNCGQYENSMPQDYDCTGYGYQGNYPNPMFYDEKVIQYAQKVAIDTNAMLTIKDADARNRMFLEAQKQQNLQDIKEMEAENQLKKIQTIEKNRVNREQATESLIEDSDKNLCLLVETPDGDRKCTKPVLNISHVFSQMLWAVGTEKEIVRICWTEGGKSKVQYVTKDTTAKALAKRMRQMGVMFKVKQERMLSLYDHFLSYVMEKAESTEIPLCWGWNKMADGSWVFADDEVITMEVLERYE